MLDMFDPEPGRYLLVVLSGYWIAPVLHLGFR